MRDYFMALVIAAIIGTVMSMLAGGTFEKYVKYIVALVCVIIILMPLKEFVGLTIDFDSFEQTQSMPEVSNSDKWVLKVSKDRVIEAINGAIYKRFGILPQSIDIDIESTSGELTVNSVTVILGKDDAKYATEVRNYLEGLLNVEVSVGTGEEEVTGE